MKMKFNHLFQNMSHPCTYTSSKVKLHKEYLMVSQRLYKLYLFERSGHRRTLGFHISHVLYYYVVHSVLYTIVHNTEKQAKALTLRLCCHGRKVFWLWGFKIKG